MRVPRLGLPVAGLPPTNRDPVVVSRWLVRWWPPARARKRRDAQLVDAVEQAETRAYQQAVESLYRGGHQQRRDTGRYTDERDSALMVRAANQILRQHDTGAQVWCCVQGDEGVDVPCPMLEWARTVLLEHGQ